MPILVAEPDGISYEIRRSPSIRQGMSAWALFQVLLSWLSSKVMKVSPVEASRVNARLRNVLGVPKTLGAEELHAASRLSLFGLTPVPSYWKPQRPGSVSLSPPANARSPKGAVESAPPGVLAAIACQSITGIDWLLASLTIVPLGYDCRTTMPDGLASSPSPPWNVEPGSGFGVGERVAADAEEMPASTKSAQTTVSRGTRVQRFIAIPPCIAGARGSRRCEVHFERNAGPWLRGRVESHPGVQGRS